MKYLKKFIKWYLMLFILVHLVLSIYCSYTLNDGTNSYQEIQECRDPTGIMRIGN